MGKYLDLEGTKYLYKKMKSYVDTETSQINEKIYKAHGVVSVSVSPTVIETGVDTRVTVTNRVTLSGDTFTPKSISVNEGSTRVSSTPNSSVQRTIKTTTTYKANVTFIDGVSKSASATVTAVYPMYFGGNSSGTLGSAAVLALTKQSLKTSPNGSYTVAVTQGQYLWLCVPSSMKINKVTSSGFDVPMQAAATVAVDGKGNYSCYRSSSQFNAGSVNIVIS